MQKPSRKSDSGAWNSIDEALETFCSMSKVTKGAVPKSTVRSLSEQYTAGSSRTENSPTDFSENASEPEERDVDEASYIGGRGRLLKALEKQYARQHLDEKIHNELRVLFGPGFSNESIERYHASACSSSSERSMQETGVFTDCETEINQEIDFVIGESNIMKKINAAGISNTKKKLPRCRNAIILNLTQKKTSGEAVQDEKNVPVLKGPDLFLPNKSYSSALTAAKGSSNYNQGDEPIFTADDFPKL